MSRFSLIYTSVRGSLCRHTLPAGDSVHVHGRATGVKVTPRGRGASGQTDEFDIYMTTGHSDRHPDTWLGTVRYTPAGPTWNSNH